ncbi:MAG: IclR family transcriptional regulator [Desulfarculus sp.]|nr:IclR family transcriptional regulator [Desulfarculus sp.]
MPNQSIQRATRILSLFSYSRPRLRVSQIAREMGLPVGTVHGLVRTLEQEGFLSQDPQTRQYRLGMRLHELGSIHLATLEINQKAAIPLSYLARETGLVGRLGVLERGVIVVTLDTLPLSKASVAPFIGAAAPAYCTSMGRAILAHLPQEAVGDYFDKAALVKFTPRTIVDRQALLEELAVTRQRGYSLSLQEFLVNLDSVGAPIFGEGGQVAGALSLNGEPRLVSEANLQDLARRVMETAAEVSRQLGHYQYLEPMREV